VVGGQNSDLSALQFTLCKIEYADLLHGILHYIQCTLLEASEKPNILSVSIRGPKPNLKADRTPKKTSDLATDGHGYTRMRIAGFLALHREKIGIKLYGYVLAKRYTSRLACCSLAGASACSCPRDSAPLPRG